MRRHTQTAIAAIDASGRGDYDVDEGWNEFDHLAIARAYDPVNSVTQDPAAFQVVLNAALDRWRAGHGEHEETYVAFVDRIKSAFGRAVARAGSGRTVAVFTSGGPIAMVCSHLLTGDDSVFQRLNDIVVNAGVTTVIVGRRGPRLLAFNEHAHVPRDLITFR